MAKDRLTQHIEDLKATLQSLKETDSRVSRYVALQESLERAESVNQEILEAEEKIPHIAEPKERKIRRKKEEMNGGVTINSIAAAAPDLIREDARE